MLRCDDKFIAIILQFFCLSLNSLKGANSPRFTDYAMMTLQRG